VGQTPPATGPVLFVANHPNSLVDPVLVTAAADRPVRFLAKAPLFEEPLVGPLVRAAGAIPVYRRQDDPELVQRNANVFEEVHDSLSVGDAVGIFPEGLSHSEPSLARLRTGAARIVLGAAERIGVEAAIVPMGIVLPHKDRFRSRAYVLVGRPLQWEDLATRGEGDTDAVRTLTDRIECALRDLTINLERIEDGPLIACAEAVYAAELDLDRAPEERIRRMREATERWRELREEEPQEVEALVDRLRSFAAALAALDLSPKGLEATARPRVAVGWSARNLAYFLLGTPVALVGSVVFFVPYFATDWTARRPGLPPDIRSARKFLGGGVLYILWCALLSVVVVWAFGIPAGIAAAVSLPLLALLTLVVRERWRDARREVRQYLVLRRSGDVREQLLDRRRELAGLLESLRRSDRGDVPVRGDGPADGEGGMS
jgi:glycerol-3-phosphate O-acyltransferase/dihydroxyacetone phosphate acyltransferase